MSTIVVTRRPRYLSRSPSWITLDVEAVDAVVAVEIAAVVDLIEVAVAAVVAEEAAAVDLAEAVTALAEVEAAEGAVGASRTSLCLKSTTKLIFPNSERNKISLS